MIEASNHSAFIPPHRPHHAAYQTLMKLSPQSSRFVEVGMGWGRGLVCAAQAASQLARKDISLIGVDDFRFLPDFTKPDRILRAAMDDVGYGDAIEIRKGDAISYASQFIDRSLFCVVIDLEEDPKTTALAMLQWIHKIRDGGYLMFYSTLALEDFTPVFEKMRDRLGKVSVHMMSSESPQ